MFAYQLTIKSKDLRFQASDPSWNLYSSCMLRDVG